jgi:V8-like Glu-specific endopeptidase
VPSRYGTADGHARHRFRVGDDVFVIQHPRGGPKQIVMANNEVDFVDDTIVHYSTDTLPGSSGSPVFDWQWRLVALHHEGGSSPSRTPTRRASATKASCQPQFAPG